ncbi:disease resistance-like protein DSC1 [Senna tora]|uniref:Disease resistance-like protein DSC1 n=1 Tax=Senna tora TaxID=362788 RepID=A0A834SR04_9FABA|nr:disease resistance-like protein DSC1 [Senna tora]
MGIGKSKAMILLMTMMERMFSIVVIRSLCMLETTLFDHVCLWCHETFSSKIRERIKESRASSNLTILLKLDFDCDPLEIKEYGVCPTYACEYQNFIKETLPPKQESKNLIFPALPIATWKTKTLGLKDIIYP